MSINQTVKPYILTPVKELPQTKRQKHSIYDDIINDVMINPEKLIRIDVPTKVAKSMYTSFRNRVKKRNLPLKIMVRDKALYIGK